MKRLWVVIFLLIVLVVGGWMYWTSGNQPANADDTSEKIFVIPQGAAVREIGNSLKSEGLIKDPVVFFVYIKINSLDKGIQYGDHKLSPSMTLAEVVDNLRSGTVDVWVTIPEGYRAEEIADTLREKVPTYDEGWRTELNKQEGYLFPDTYLMPVDADIETVIAIFKNNFANKIGEIGLSEDSPSLLDTITIASLIEREAITDSEKPLIAGVIKNRIDTGMGLDIDATLQYITGESGNWWKVPTGAERQIDSQYNTYRYRGLPPGPIANPGIESIKAALNPQNNDYFYYIHAGGQIYPAKTLDEHNANVRRYLN